MLTTVENVAMAKKSYESFYNIVQRNFYSTMQQLSVDEQNEIRDDFLRENFWWEDATWQLDSWISFYFKSEDFQVLKNFFQFLKLIYLIFQK